MSRVPGSNLRRHLAWILLIAVAGCAPKMPTKVVPEEYEVYSAWLRHHFEKEPPSMLHLATRTFAWPTEALDSRSSSIGKAMKQAGADNSLAGRLAALGEAEYPLDLHSKAIEVPWEFKEANAFPDGFPTDPPGWFRLVAFSRVAFNASHTQALFAVFAVSNSCGGLCGGGGMLLGRREHGAWIFQQTGCIWVY